MKVPRTYGKETTRENDPSRNTGEYLRRVVFISIIDHLISELELKFNPDFYGILPLEEGRGGLVVRSRPRDRRVAGSKPDSTEDPPCMGPVAR
ncbi:hypothetical protein AVEN_249248-1 [Araneus ventricosus]|uniref:Uncharacterized protein n=1 Tax=Araneus ventricosus TaxID=182803 RepID=A0A4Y2MKA5_ARAVE|nr:hypothetical protein AVEN_249248-1 [Araneus ventricosus]